MSTENSYLQECPKGSINNIDGDCIKPLYYNRPSFKVTNWTSNFSFIPGIAAGTSDDEYTKQLCNKFTGNNCQKCESKTLGVTTGYYYSPPCNSNYAPKGEVCDTTCVLKEYKDKNIDIDDLKNMQHQIDIKYDNRIRFPYVNENKFNRSINFIRGTEIPSLSKSVDARFNQLNTSLTQLINDIKHSNYVQKNQIPDIKTDITNSITSKVLPESKSYTDSNISIINQTLNNKVPSIENKVNDLERLVNKYNNQLYGTIIPSLKRENSNALEQTKQEIINKITQINNEHRQLLESVKAIRETEIPRIDLSIKTQINGLRTELSTNNTQIESKISELKNTLNSAVDSAKTYSKENIDELQNKINAKIDQIERNMLEYNNIIRNLQSTIIPSLYNQHLDHKKLLKDKETELNNSINDLKKDYEKVMKILYNTSSALYPNNATFKPRY